MKSNLNFFINNYSSKTKPIITTLVILFFVFVYFIVVWLLFGEFNLLNLNWLVYPGKPNSNDPKLVAAYAQIDSQIYYFLFLPGIVYVGIIFVLRLFKQFAWDLIPIFFSLWMSWVVLILSATLPFPYSILMISLRILLVGLTFFVVFVFVNFLLNQFLIRSQLGVNHFVNLSQEQIKITESSKTFCSLFLKNKDLIIDIDPKNIFINHKK